MKTDIISYKDHGDRAIKETDDYLFDKMTMTVIFGIDPSPEFLFNINNVIIVPWRNKPLRVKTCQPTADRMSIFPQR